MNEMPAMPRSTLWTIGHSTRSIEELLSLLSAQAIVRLVDVRRYPGSRRYPHFHADALRESLEAAGLDYRHLPALGGRRTPRVDSPNRGWKNAGFRGYADYMHTDRFHQAIQELMTSAGQARTVIMCAEAVPWRCHRALIADALVVHEWDVTHILGPGQLKPHQLTSFATIEGGRLVYPAPPDQDITSRLF